MNHHFKLCSLLCGIATALAALTLSTPTRADAFEPVLEQEDGRQQRFVKTLQISRGTPEVQLEVYREPQDSRRIWHVVLANRDRPDSPLCATTLPRAAGQPYYNFSAKQAELGLSRHLILLEARPNPDESPLDSPVYQIALQLEPHQGAARWRCSIAARGEHTQLDGGPVLSLDESGDPPTLVRHNVESTVRFCGLRPGEDPGYERLDPGTGRFVPAAQVELIVEDAGELEARLPDRTLTPPLTENLFTWIAASSDVRGAPVGLTVPRPLSLGDLDLSTAWVEGASGAGEFVTATVSTAAKLRGLRIFPGHGRSAEHFAGHGRPTRLLIGLSDGFRFEVDLPEHSYEELLDRGGLYIEFPEPLITRCLSVMILNGEPGALARSRDPDRRRLGEAIAISEITPYSTLDAETESQTARRILAELMHEPSAERRDRIANFATLIPDAMVAAISTILTSEEESRRLRVIPLLGQLPPERALPVLGEHLIRVPVQAADYRITKRTIAAHGAAAAPTLLEILGEVEGEERKHVDTVRLVGRVGSDVQIVQLVDGLGKGQEFLRRERIRAIATAGIAALPRLLAIAEEEDDSEVGLDALTTIVFIGQRHFQHEPARIDEAEVLHEVFLQSTSRPHRIRAIESMGYFLHPEGVAILDDTILQQARDPILRQFAASALRLYPEPEARQALERALSDESPDVRIAAIRALNRRPDSAAATASVVDFVEAERWPQALHHALHLLARSDEPAALEAVAAVVERDVRSATAGTALRALRHAERALPLATIVDHLDNQATPHAIRRQLVDMLAISESSVAETTLITIADGEHEAIALRPDEERAELRERALIALGRRDSPVARTYLLDAVQDDERSLSMRGAALRGMAFVADEDLLHELQAIAPRLPRELRSQARQTIGLIRNRLALKDADREIEQIRESLEEQNRDPAEDF